MKVLQINCVFRYGSTGKIMDELHKGLKERGHESVIAYGRGVKYKEAGVHKVSSEIEAKIHSLSAKLFGGMFGFSPLATRKLIRLIKNEKPDVVHLHCLNGNFVNVYKVIEYLKKNRIKTVLTLHAEIMHTAGCGYALECEKWRNGCYECRKMQGMFSRLFRDDAKRSYNRMKKAISNSDNLILAGVSAWVTDRAVQSAIMQGIRHTTVHNGVDLNSFCMTEYSELKRRLKIPEDKKIILYVTPDFHNPIKGGQYVLEAAKRLPEVQFVMVGFNGDKKLLPDNVIAISHTKDKKELAAFYSMADLTMLTSKKETFSMIVAESLCCGTPVVGFEAGAPETIAIPEFSRFSEFGNIDELVKETQKMLSVEFDKQRISKEARLRFSNDAMVEGYLAVYENRNL